MEVIFIPQKYYRYDINEYAPYSNNLHKIKEEIQTNLTRAKHNCEPSVCLDMAEIQS